MTTGIVVQRVRKARLASFERYDREQRRRVHAMGIAWTARRLYAIV